MFINYQSTRGINLDIFNSSEELKMVLSLVTSLEPKEQRLLFKGKERDNSKYLHMVGVRDKDKVLLLEDPAIKERKLHGLAGGQAIGTPCRTISV
jgi:predicted sulfurtransferase